MVDVDKADGIPMNSFYSVNGEPITNTRYVRLTEGTPYFLDSWLPGVAVSDKDVRYKTKRVKLDLFGSEVHFLTEQDQELICTVPLKELTLTDAASGASYTFVQASFVPALSSVKKGWYRQLVTGTASLYVDLVKTISEFKPYNSPVAEQKIITTEEFLIAVNGNLLRAKKAKDVPALLPDKKSELENFLKRSELKNASNAERMTALINHYNSL